MNILICGDQGQGKTTACIKLSSLLKLKGHNVRGFLCPKDRIINLRTGKEVVFLKHKKEKNTIEVGRFFVTRKGLDFGHECLKNIKKHDFVFIDQFWKLELQKKGFYKLIKNNLGKANLIIIVRKIALEQFLEFFSGYKFKIFELNPKNQKKLPEEILDFVKKR